MTRILPLAFVLAATACVKSGQVVEHPTAAPQRTFDPSKLCNSADTQSLCTPISQDGILIDTNLVAPASNSPALG